MAEREMTMKTRMKKVSALVLAATMAMGTYTSAFAADMTVYLRRIGEDKAKTPEGSFVVHDVDSSMSIYQALEETKKDKDMLDKGITLDSTWSKVTNKDNTVDWYLTSLTVTDGTNTTSHTNNGGNTKLYKDSEGNYIGGVYAGNSWMWCPMTGDLNSTAYPDDITLSDQKCKDADFSIILSYDYSSFEWGDTTGTPEP